MTNVAADLRTRIESALPVLRALSEADVSENRDAGKWVKKEILGHLIDSAVNNHQRFVRAQFESPFVGPGYDQKAWVQASGYRRRAWVELIDLWAALNRQLASVMELIPADRLATPCVIANNPPATLEWVMADYVDHMNHHLEQIIGHGR